MKCECSDPYCPVHNGISSCVKVQRGMNMLEPLFSWPLDLETIPLERRSCVRRSEPRQDSPGRRAEDVAEYLQAVWTRETRGKE